MRKIACIHWNAAPDCRICALMRSQHPFRAMPKPMPGFTMRELAWFRHPAVDRRGESRL